MNTTWEVILEENERGELILPFGEEFMKKHNWQVGDRFEWAVGDGCVIIANITAQQREKDAGID
jgi:hypothetical protein